MDHLYNGYVSHNQRVGPFIMLSIHIHWISMGYPSQKIAKSPHPFFFGKSATIQPIQPKTCWGTVGPQNSVGPKQLPVLIAPSELENHHHAKKTLKIIEA